MCCTHLLRISSIAYRQHRQDTDVLEHVLSLVKQMSYYSTCVCVSYKLCEPTCTPQSCLENCYLSPRVCTCGRLRDTSTLSLSRGRTGRNGFSQSL